MMLMDESVSICICSIREEGGYFRIVDASCGQDGWI